MEKFLFKGEESARFAKFATELIEVFGVNVIPVILEGREPISSKYVNITGKIADALNQGYRRHVQIIEDDTGTIYWAAGTNATGSIATITIEFDLSQEQKEKLILEGRNRGWFVPTLASCIGLDLNWCLVDEAAQNVSLDNANRLINLFSIDNGSDLLRETALALRSYEHLLSHHIRIRTEYELLACKILESIKEIDDYKDATIAITELIGYIGTSRSIPILKKLIFHSPHAHVKWAAIIAIGRLPSDDVFDILLEATSMFNITTHTSSILQKSAVSDEEWVEAALLLCIARRVTGISDVNVRNRLETYFCSYFSSKNMVLHRYSCLGLSQFESLSIVTIDNLIELLNSANSLVGKGYYAMALLPIFRANLGINKSLNIWNDERLEAIKDVLRTTFSHAEDSQEPDAIWALENLADLALEIEDNMLANKYHLALAALFYDWRFSYYEALAAYEKAELSIVNHRPYSYVLGQFQSAINCLKEVQSENKYAMSIIGFRISIINARIELLSIINEWNTAANRETLLQLKNKLRISVINTYNLYIVGETQQGISRRELGCIKETVRILTIIEKVIFFHSELYRYVTISEELRNILSEIVVDISQLIEQGGFSFDHAGVLLNIYEWVRRIKDEIGQRNSYENILRLIHEIVVYLNEVSWTMPAQMCLLNGLGKGVITLVNDFNYGQGTSDIPYTIEIGDVDDFNAILSIALVVATGAAVQTTVICEQTGKRQILSGIVEGSAICHFKIPLHFFANNITVPISFYLEFSTNDIVQKSSPTVFYLRRASF